MRIDVVLRGELIDRTAEIARQAEDIGFDGIWFGETLHDPFVLVSLAIGATKSVSVGTSIALAFPRNPMSLAYTCWDLQKLSDGRLILGLGSQVKGHIERRFGLKWERPVARMKDFILGLRAVWRAWQTGERLDFRGKYYSFSLMTPFFDPGPIPKPDIPIFIAAVNKGMYRLAGQFCQGVHIHPFHSVEYLKEVALPALRVGASRAGRDWSEIQKSASVFVATGRNKSELEAARYNVKRAIAFYGSTRTYRRVFEVHGWQNVSDILHEKSISGEWGEMPNQITDEMFEAFAVEGAVEEIGSIIEKKYSGLLDRVSLYLEFPDAGMDWRGLVSVFKH